MSQFLEVAEQAAKKAGAIAHAGFRGTHTRSWKADDSPVTEIDEAAEQAAIKIIQQTFPDHAILAEESGRAGEHDYQWVIDPIDGTRNFTHGIPLYASVVALLHHGLPEAAVICLPEFDECIAAERGKGATLNGTRLALTSPPRLNRALVGFTAGRTQLETLEQYKAIRARLLSNKIGSARVFGSASTQFAYLAVGRLNVLIAHHPEIWDLVPGALLAIEAGATALRYDGSPWQPGNPDLILAHPDLVSEIVTAIGEHS